MRRFSARVHWLLFAAASVAGGIALAQQSAPEPADASYFETHIRPLLIRHCYECHSDQQDRREGNLALDLRSGWAGGGESGPAIVPGDPEGSLLIRAVRYEDPDLQMPPSEALSSEQVERLVRWIASGAPDPRDGSGKASRPPLAPSDPEQGKSHWAFQPLSDPPVPRFSPSAWPRSTIDAFVLNQLQRQGLQPAPDADRRDLARRVYYQLIGLPPTAEQMTAFLEDQRPDALSRMVDQLLASPQFGETWGRHWLDLARYADSNGLDENFLFREAWRYRNWVIDVINGDLAYDCFLQQQIAGDLLPHDSIAQRDRQRIASGFLVVGPKVLLGNDPKKQKMEVADEQIDTIGRAVLGQTLGCARCHDHKFDPIPTADYYALAGIFGSTQVVERRYMLGQQREMERLVGLGADGDQRDEQYEAYWRERPKLVERRKHAQAALKSLQEEDSAAFAKLVQEHADAIAQEVADESLPVEQRQQMQQDFVAELNQRIENQYEIPPRAMIAADIQQPADEPIRIAGQFDRLGANVARGRLRVLGDQPLQISADQSGRVELSRWLTDHEHGAGHLSARVLANRIWHHLIGRGLVRTVDNFGRTGEAPTHPQLLDHLAGDLIESNWSIKSLVRRIVLSRAFAMSSDYHDAAAAIDPANQWLWRGHRRRLSPEAFRDSMLLCAGQLDSTPMESSVWYLGDQATAVGANKNRRRTDFPSRSVYLPVIRNDLPELFQAFDFADPHIATGMRSDTTVAMQGLYVLNDEMVMDAARQTAARVLRESTGTRQQQAGKLLTLVFGGTPSAQDQADLAKFVRETEQRLSTAATEATEDSEPNDARQVTLSAWSIACQALFASSRFQMIE